MVTARGELEALLARDAADIRGTERHEFDRLSRGRPIVLMGAGRLGRRTVAGLRANGVEPLTFADNNAAAHGTTVNGVTVQSPAAAAERFGREAAFVVTIWAANSPHRFAHSREQLRALGCDLVLPFPPLFWKHADALLPFYLQDLPSKVLDARDDVARAFDVWEDDASRAEYVAQVRLRLVADFDGLPHPVAHPQYLPDDLFVWSGDEWIVDAGAYDGDTLRAIAELRGSRVSHVLALEPDPANFAQLQATVSRLASDLRQNVECRQVAAASAAGSLYLDASGTASSAVSSASTGTVAVAAETIDALVAGARPTFLKFDIEGAELDALQGARRTLARCRPVVAICVYHQQDHLWRIPLQLFDWCRDYAFFLRPHNEEGWDLVCYAVPRERLAGNR